MKWNKAPRLGLFFGQTLRLLLGSRETMFVVLASFGIMLLLIGQMEVAKEEKSTIALGIVDEDETVLSGRLMDHLKENGLFAVSQGELSEELEKLRGGEVKAVLLIKEGYQQKLSEGAPEKVITVYETGQDGVPLLRDMIAGEMMADVCTAKGYLEYRSVWQERGEPPLSKEEYAAYVAEGIESGRFEFCFETTYLGGVETAEKPEPALIYRQLTLAVAAMLLEILAVYACVPYYRIRHGKMAERSRLLPASAWTLWAGCAMGALLFVLAFGILLVGLFSLRDGTLINALTRFLYTAGFCSGIVVIAMLAAGRSGTIMQYQCGMLLLVLVSGILGMLSVFGGVLIPEKAADWMPNYWYIRHML